MGKWVDGNLRGQGGRQLGLLVCGVAAEARRGGGRHGWAGRHRLSRMGDERGGLARDAGDGLSEVHVQSGRERGVVKSFQLCRLYKPLLAPRPPLCHASIQVYHVHGPRATFWSRRPPLCNRLVDFVVQPFIIHASATLAITEPSDVAGWGILTKESIVNNETKLLRNDNNAWD